MAERSNDYPTGNPNGMSFICNQWVFTGPEGYRVQRTSTGDANGDWSVFRYEGASMHLVHGGRDMSEDDAHAYAARLARRPVNVAQEGASA